MKKAICRMLVALMIFAVLAKSDTALPAFEGKPRLLINQDGASWGQTMPIKRHEKENCAIGKCKSVSCYDMGEALHQAGSLSYPEKAFSNVREIARCSAGFGGVRGRIPGAIFRIIRR